MAEPVDSPDVSASWVAPAVRTDGQAAVLKIPMPRLEGEQEIDGLRFWAGDPVVRLLEHNDTSAAMLLEHCVPGTSLRECSDDVQDHMRDLSRPSTGDVLLGTDVHAGNVLRAEREPWLVIDPKPFIGDSAYDATQHLISCRERVAADPERIIEQFAALLDVDARRVRAWLFARLAAEPRDLWSESSLRLARVLQP